MGLYDDSRTQLINALYAWDFTPAFPVGYTPPLGGDGILIVPAWPIDLIDNMLRESNDGQMTMPIISIVANYVYQWHRTLGANVSILPNYPLTAGTNFRKGNRMELTFLSTVWTDAKLGAGETAEKIAGQLAGAIMFNQFRLTSFRNLRTQHARLVYVDRPQLWRFDSWIDGDTILSYDTSSNLYQ